MLFDQENNINKLCAQGMQMEGEGRKEQAAQLFRQAWDEAATDLERLTAAHYLARHQPTVADKLKWDVTALDLAKKMETDEVKSLLPSLYLNIAKCHEDLNDVAEAREHYLLAQRYFTFLPDDGYGNMIRSSIVKGIERSTNQSIHMQLPSAFIPASPDCEIVSTRVVNAPRETVYTAWANPEYLKEWWGPAGFTNTFNEFDFRVGGGWDFIMHGPEKGHYHNKCEFTRIEEPSLIAWKRYSQPLFQVVATFEAVSPDKTKIVFRQIFDSAKECNKVKPFAVEKNEENFDRLEAVLSKMSASV